MKSQFWVFAGLAILFACNQKAQTSKKIADSVETNNSLAKEIQNSMTITGTWNLVEINAAKVEFRTLYPSRVPFIKLDPSGNTISGNTSCNTFSGNIIITENKIKLEAPLMMTQRACPGDGESTFLSNLQRVRNFRLPSDTVLEFHSEDSLVMKFLKKP